MGQGWTTWRLTTRVFRWTRGCTALPECCYCRRHANETQTSYWDVPRGTPIDQIPYCSPTPRLRCAPGKGCNAAPWSRAGMHLREGMWDGPPPFIRTRDGAHLAFAE